MSTVNQRLDMTVIRDAAGVITIKAESGPYSVSATFDNNIRAVSFIHRILTAPDGDLSKVYDNPTEPIPIEPIP